MSGRPKLDYPFTPSPRFLLKHVRLHQLTPEQYLLLAVLYDRADPDLLRDRRETPELTLAMIARAVSSDEPEGTLSKRLLRLRDRGYFRYRIERRAGRRAFYVFQLDPDAQSVCEQCLSEKAEPCPSVRDPQTRAATPSGPEAQPLMSECPEGVPDPPLSEQPARLSECPEPADPHGEQDCEQSAPEPCPSVSDVQERTNFSRTERSKDQEESFLSVDYWTSFDEREKEERSSGFLAAHAEPKPTELGELIERTRLASERNARDRTRKLAAELPDDEREADETGRGHDDAEIAARLGVPEHQLDDELDRLRAHTRTPE